MNSLRKLLGWRPVTAREEGRDPAVNVQCSEFEVNNWVVSGFILDKLVPVVGVHPFPINELVLIVSAVCRLKPTHIFEWGTHVGKSARIFYETASHFGLNIEIHSVDLPDDVAHQEHPGRQHGVFVKGLRGVHLHRGDGLTTSVEIYRRLPKPVRPLIFIDGDHSHESVKRELQGIVKDIPQADILLHDTFYQSAESGYNIGPYRAIMDVLPTLPEQYRLFATTTGLPGMTLLYHL